MDIEKITKFAADYLSDYFETFAATLISPTARFAALPTVESAVLVENKKPGPRLNPALLVYVMISLLTGILVGSLALGASSYAVVAHILIRCLFCFK